MTKKELMDRGLPKWPALVVVGDPVTPDQAEEIIIRTEGCFGWGFGCNDHEWECIVAEIMGATHVRAYPHIDSADMLAFQKKVRWIELEYLRNSRVMSSYVGGPHGWVNWDGNVFTNTYNIGKYPEVSTVYKEWTKIAKAFPYLNLRSQLFSGETCEVGIRPIVEYQVKNGKVRLTDPKEALVFASLNMGKEVMDCFRPGRERGCSAETLKAAVDLCIKKTKETA